MRASHPTAERPPPRPRGEGVRGARANAFEESGADGADGGGTNRARTKITARLLVPTTPKVKDAPREAQAGASREPQQLLHLYHNNRPLSLKAGIWQRGMEGILDVHVTRTFESSSKVVN